LGEAKEFVERGEIMLTRLNAAELIQIRFGEYELSELVAWANQLRPEAGEAKGHSPFARKSGQNVSRLIAGSIRIFGWAMLDLFLINRFRRWPARSRANMWRK